MGVLDANRNNDLLIASIIIILLIIVMLVAIILKLTAENSRASNANEV